MSDMTYDKACYELAISFLKDSKVEQRNLDIFAHHLAQDIQRCIEDFLESREL